MEENLIKGPLLITNKLGYLVPNSLKNVLQKIAIFLLFIFVLSVAFIQFFYSESEIFALIDNAQLVISVGQIFLKVILLMYNSHKMLNLIKLRENFWNSKEATEITKKKVEKIGSIIVTLQNLFGYSLAFFWVLCFIWTFIMANKKVPLGIWSMNDYTKLYKAAFPAYSLILVVCCCFVYCLDGLFIGICYETVIQFKILCDRLERMDVEDIQSEQELNNFYSQLKVYVEHHRFLCSFVNAFQDYYSTVYMVEYITSAPLICAFYYAVCESPNIALKLQYGVAASLIITQLSFYCIPLTLLSQEVISVSTAIYNSNWYSKHYLKLKTATLLIIQQAQQEIRFTAWELIDMNATTLVDIIQVAFSTTTFLRSLK